MDNNSSKKLHILVVEDSSSARMSIVTSLQAIDAVIHEADDGMSALSFLRQENTSVDLVLSDLIMKAMDGDELCHKIRNELGHKDLPVIILSSQTDKDSILKLFNAGATDYLYKPFMAEELVARIKAHLEQRKLHKILKKNINELSELNKMKDHFLAACSHDFRSPLQGILGFTELLINDSSLSAHHRSSLKNIIESGNQLHNMIESLLDFSLAGNKPEDITMIPLHLIDIIETCVKTISFTADNKKINVQINPVTDFPFFKGNPNALFRIFNNLLSNAVKFTSPGGRVTVDFENKNTGFISISVTDTGMGIPEDMIPNIFDRYSKASRKGTMGEKSNGLGLHITRQLVELHSGEITVKSHLNKGSCFTVTFPLKPEEN
ncbi:MAG: response regulator [Proteobacteria bacterium]|nr:response regulator [Pseudomonadota bacterium]